MEGMAAAATSMNAEAELLESQPREGRRVQVLVSTVPGPEEISWGERVRAAAALGVVATALLLPLEQVVGVPTDLPAIS